MPDPIRPRDMYSHAWTQEQILAALKKYNVKVIAFRPPRDGELFIPAGATTLRPAVCVLTTWSESAPRYIVEPKDGV